VERVRVRAVEDAPRLYLGALLLPRESPRPNWIRARRSGTKKKRCSCFSNRIEFEFSERENNERETNEEAPELADRQRAREEIAAPPFEEKKTRREDASTF